MQSDDNVVQKSLYANPPSETKRCLTRKKKAVEERFWPKVNKNGPVPAHCPELGCCWVWTGSRSVVGGEKSYGTLSVRGVSGYKPVGAHRISFILANSSIASGMLILHHCDNKPCVRPTHLYQGNASRNGKDAYDRALREAVSLPGEKHPMAKLTWNQVVEIRALHGVKALDDIAAQFNVSRSTIEDIVYGRSWKIKPTEAQNGDWGKIKSVA